VIIEENVVTRMYVCHCCACGVRFAFPSSLEENLRKDGKHFYCPNGHGQYFGESEAKKLTRQFVQVRQQLDQEKARADEAERDRLRVREELRKTQERVSKGVCPVCKRSFCKLRQHMESKHPEFAKGKAKS
jgi:hypothetical protein